MEKTNAPTINAIANYWINQEIELPNVEQEDMFHHCWNCGEDKRSNSKKNKVRLERCHIIAKSLGGGFEPSNFFLLCSLCHREAPNTSDKNDIWHWLESNRNRYSFYGTYNLGKALDLYEKQEGESFFEHAKSIENLSLAFELEFQKITTHLYFFNVSTNYYLLRAIIKNHSKTKNLNNENDINKVVSSISKKANSFIREKTSAALAEKRKQTGEWRTGLKKNGQPCFDADAKAKAADVIKAKSQANHNLNEAKEAYLKLTEKKKNMTFDEIAKWLNDNGFRTAKNNLFNRYSVMRLGQLTLFNTCC